MFENCKITCLFVSVVSVSDLSLSSSRLLYSPDEQEPQITESKAQNLAEERPKEVQTGVAFLINLFIKCNTAIPSRACN